MNNKSELIYALIAFSLLAIFLIAWLVVDPAVFNPMKILLLIGVAIFGIVMVVIKLKDRYRQ